MATATFNNNIELSVKQEDGTDVKLKANKNKRAFAQSFTMTSGTDKPLLEFFDGTGDTKKSIAKITRNDTGTYLQLDKAVISLLPLEVQDELFTIKDKTILEIGQIEGQSPITLDAITFDETSNELRATIKARDGDVKYTCVINALGVQLQYGNSKCDYLSENQDGSPKVLHPTMSTECFEDMIMGTSGMIKLTGQEGVNLATNPGKIPSFMVGTYLQAMDENNEKAQKLEGGAKLAGLASQKNKNAQKQVTVAQRYEREGYEIFSFSVPTPSAQQGYQSFYFWKSKNDNGTNEVKVYHDGKFSAELTSLTMTYDQNLQPHLNINRSHGQAFDIPISKVVSRASSSSDDKITIPSVFVDAIESFKEFTGLDFKMEKSAEDRNKDIVKGTQKTGLVAEPRDATDKTEIKTKIRGKKLSATFDMSTPEVSQAEPEQPAPTEGENPTPTQDGTEGPSPRSTPPAEQPDETETPQEGAQDGAEQTPSAPADENPFTPTGLKAVEPSKFKINGDWGLNIMLIGIILMFIAMPFAPAIAAVLAGVGAAVTAGGLALALNTDRLNNPYLKLEKYLIDPLSRKERELENEQQAFWENDKEFSKASNAFKQSMEGLKEQDSAAFQYFQSIFGADYEKFIGDIGLDDRMEFITELQGLVEAENLSDEQKNAFIDKYFGSTGVYGKEGETPNFDGLRDRIFNADQKTTKSAIEEIRKHNAIHEQKNQLEDKADEMLTNASDELWNKIIRNENLSPAGKARIVERNALSFAQHMAYQSKLSQAQAQEIFDSLPQEALDALHGALTQIEEKQTEIENTAIDQFSRDKVVAELTAYKNLVSDLQNAEKNVKRYGEQAKYITDEQISNATIELLKAQTLEGLEDYSPLMEQIQQFETKDQPIAEKLQEVLSDNKHKELAAQLEKRNQALTQAGLFTELGKQMLSGETAQKLDEWSISDKLKEELKQEVIGSIPDRATRKQITKLSLEDIVREIENGEIECAKNSRLNSLYTAYKADKKAEDIIDAQIDFDDLTQDSDLVSDDDVAFRQDEFIQRYPNLENYSETSQKSIIKLAIMMETKQANVLSLVSEEGQEEAKRRFAETHAGDLKALDFLLNHDIASMLEDKCLSEVYKRSKNVESVNASYSALSERYQTFQLPIVGNIPPRVAEKILATNPQSWGEFKKAVNDIVGQQKIYSAEDRGNLTSTENRPQATGITMQEFLKLKPDENGAERTLDPAVANHLIETLREAYQSQTDRNLLQAGEIVGQKQAQRIYQETKKAIQSAQKKGEAVDAHPEKASLKTAKTKNHEVQSTKQQIALRQLKTYGEQFDAIMRDRASADEIIAKLEQLQNDMLTKTPEDLGLERTSILSPDEIRNITKKLLVPLPTPDKSGRYDWKTYRAQMQKSIEESKKKAEEKKKKQQEKLFGGKKPAKQTLGQEKARGNVKKLKAMIEQNRNNNTTTENIESSEAAATAQQTQFDQEQHN